MKLRKVILSLLFIYIIVVLTGCSSYKPYDGRITDVEDYISSVLKEEYTLVQEKSINDGLTNWTQMDLSLFYHPIHKQGRIGKQSEGNCGPVAIFNSIRVSTGLLTTIVETHPEKEFESDDCIPYAEVRRIPELYYLIREDTKKNYGKIEAITIKEIRYTYERVASHFGYEVTYEQRTNLNNQTLQDAMRFIDDGMSPILSTLDHPFYQAHAMAIVGYKTYLIKNKLTTFLEVADGASCRNSSYINCDDFCEASIKCFLQFFSYENVMKTT